MQLISLEFAYLFVVFLAVYWLLRPAPKAQNALILAASYGLAASLNPWFAALMAAYALGVWLLGLWLARENSGKWSMGMSVILALAPMLGFKYYEFAREVFDGLLRFAGLQSFLPAADLILPVGLSFYTFNAITYLVSCFKGEIKPAKPWEIATHLSFFPILTAGPITRAADFLPQLRARRRNVRSFETIAVLIALALVKKVWLASYLGQYWTGPIFDSPEQFNSLELIGGLYAYALQIYFDFSGYSDLAMALALSLGFEIPRNFDNPYFARNLKQFWGRWHISLSTWIRDYIYIPLGGNRKGFARAQLYTMIGMVASGAWHNPGWNFLLWGAFHGAAVTVVNVWAKATGKRELPLWLARFLTFNCVCFAWLLFNCKTMAETRGYLAALAANWTSVPVSTPVFGLFALLLAASLLGDRWRALPQKMTDGAQRLPFAAQTLAMALFAIVVVVLSPSGIPNFIYANF